MATMFKASAVLALIAAALIAPSAASAQSVSIGEPMLVAKGAAVSVPVTVTCSLPAGTTVLDSASLYIAITQRVSQNRVATGEAYAGLRCDGTPQTLQMVATSYNWAFKAGVALLRGYLTVCGINPDTGDYICESEQIDAREVRIKSR